MKKIAKHFSIFLAILMVILSMTVLAACSNENDGSEKSSETYKVIVKSEEGEEVELTLESNATLAMKAKYAYGEDTADILEELELNSSLDFTFAMVTSLKGTYEESTDNTITAKFTNELRGYEFGGADAEQVKETYIKKLQEMVDQENDFDEEELKEFKVIIDIIKNDKLIDYEEATGEKAPEVEAIFKLDKDAKTAALLTMTTTDPDGIRTVKQYDEEGRKLSSVSYYENGNKSSEQEYDENGNPKFRISYHENGNKSSEQEYDENGNTKSEIVYYENGNKEREYGYDENGNVISSILYKEDGNIDYGLKYEYDENGNRKSDIYCDEDGNIFGKLEYEYDENGNRKFVIAYYGNGNKEYEIEYNENGDPKSEITYHENGKIHEKLEYEYDENGKLKWESYICYTEDGKILSSWECEYDENGNVISAIDYDENGNPI